MAMSKILVEVAYATPSLQKIIEVEVEEGSTIETAIDRSGIIELFPEIDLNTQKVGIFSQIKRLSDQVIAKDRVEIYRPLSLDPKDARRKRVVPKKVKKPYRKDLQE